MVIGDKEVKSDLIIGDKKKVIKLVKLIIIKIIVNIIMILLKK